MYSGMCGVEARAGACALCPVVYVALLILLMMLRWCTKSCVDASL
jgi:hypothetical protein